jgi:glycosyltransferase involved in cell wall biosynthesis
MAERARIAQVITRFSAGAGGVALRGARALDPAVAEVAIFAAPGGSLLPEAEEAGFEVTRVRHLVPEIDPLEDARALIELRGLLVDGSFDIVHTHSAKAGALGRVAARMAGVPAVVHTFHGFPFHEFQSHARRTAYIGMERRLARLTDRFLAVGSAVAAEAIRRRIVPVDRVRVIDSAVDKEIPVLSRAGRFEARQRLGVGPGMRVVGTVGRLDHQKAPGDFVAAIASLRNRDVFAVWVGDGPLRAETERDVAERGLTDRFVFTGERRDVAALLPAFDVFAMASLYEGVPCAVVEAMRCGIPVVATAVNSVHEVVEPGRTGLLVPPRDPDRLGRGIECLLDEPGDARRMAARAQENLEGRFDPDVLAADLVATYDAALARARGTVTTLRPRGLTHAARMHHRAALSLGPASR